MLELHVLVTLTAYSCLWAFMWVTWKSSGNGMMLVHRYVCAVTEFVLSIGKVSMVGDNKLTLYMAANCLHLPMPS